MCPSLAGRAVERSADARLPGAADRQRRRRHPRRLRRLPAATVGFPTGVREDARLPATPRHRSRWLHGSRRRVPRAARRGEPGSEAQWLSQRAAQGRAGGAADRDLRAGHVRDGHGRAAARERRRARAGGARAAASTPSSSWSRSRVTPTTPARPSSISGCPSERAASVVAWLVAHGVAGERLAARGYGQTRPLADNSDEPGGRATGASSSTSLRRASAGRRQP